MKSLSLFLLLHLLWICINTTSTQRNATCTAMESCGQHDSTSHFLQCVGLPSTDNGREHMLKLKGMLEATMDVYTLLKSSTMGIPLLSLQGALSLNPTADPLQNEDLIQMWMEVKIKPLLKSVTKPLLSCLSTKNFSCSTYQTVVRELSRHYSEMNPVRQKWIYSFFMYPFLADDRVAGCVRKGESSEDWLMKNFGAYRALARLKDFSALNMVFSGLEVLHLLSPAQKAELLLLPEVASLDNSTLTLIFQNVLTGGSGPNSTAHVQWGNNWTSPGHPPTNHLPSMYNQYPPVSPHSSFSEVANGFMMAARPIGSLVHNFVSFTHEHDVSKIRGATLTQFLVNWTLAELSSLYQPQEMPAVQEESDFDVTNVEDWYRQVVIPVLRRFLPNDDALMHPNITFAFHQLFYLDQDEDEETSENADVCSVSLLRNPCILTDTVVNVAHVLHCAARTNMTLSEVTVMRLIDELMRRLVSLMKELSTENIREVASDFQEIFGEPDTSSLTHEHLSDPNFIKLWFQIKVLPLLPDIPKGILSCLSTKNFSCPVYQTIVAALGKHMSFMDAPLMYSGNIYKYFIHPFLLHHNNSDPQCLSSANHSAEWMTKNFGFFARFAPITDFYQLNSNFSGLEVLHLMSPKQTAEMMLLPLSTPPRIVINQVFDFLLEHPEDRQLKAVLHSLVQHAKKMDVPCGVYRLIFDRLHSAMPSLPLDMEPSAWDAINDLMRLAPEDCVPLSTMCPVTLYNDTNLCRGINSSDLQTYLSTSMQVSCNFSLETYACAQLENFTANQLVSLLKCDLPGNSTHSKALWKMLLTKQSFILDPALDILANTPMAMVAPSAMEILDVIGEIRLSVLTDEELLNSSLIREWFHDRLSGFLTSASGSFLRCLSRRNLSCRSYQQIVQILSQLQPRMSLSSQMTVYTHFIKDFLGKNNTADTGCYTNTTNSGEWLQRNLRGFSVLVSFHDLQMLFPNFTALEALPQLTTRQLAQMSATPGQLTSSSQVDLVMKHIPDEYLAAFFDNFSPAVMINDHQVLLPTAVRSAMLQVVFDRANLSDHSVSDSMVLLWLRQRLPPLLVRLSPQHVAPFFSILSRRNCSIQQQGVEDLNSTMSSLSEVSQKEIHNHIIQSLKGIKPLQCYDENLNQSFYVFLERSFMGFQFPSVTNFLSLMPPERMHQLVNSMPPSDLGRFLRQPNVVDDDAELCVIYDNYENTAVFLETVSLPAAVQRPTLPCVWQRALSSTTRSEVNVWFDKRLQKYLVFLTKSLVSPASAHNASCLAFQKLVSVLAEYNYTHADFKRQDVFNTIRTYLTSATVPRCYNASEPDLSSTAWFANYIGAFMPFLTLEDLQNFGSTQVLQVFTVNPLNIALLNHSVLPINLTDYYTALIYQQDSNFNPLLLPLLCRCVAPGPAFSQLTAEESIVVLHNLTSLCTDLDPQVSAALAGNLGNSIDAAAISALGSESAGMSTGQIMMIKPQDLFAALGTLSRVMGWNKGQAKAIILSLMSSGMMQVNSASSLFTLGSLIMGVPTTTLSGLGGSELLTASRNPSFLGHLMTAPQVVQQTVVTQIVSISNNSEAIIENVPDELATEIPRALLLGLSNTNNVISTINRKKWKRQQAELFFGVVAVETATATLGDANNLSSSVLQGFTCTAVRSIKRVQIKKLIRACRRRGRSKVTLVETQLTCMYNYIRLDSDVANFDLYPPDVLLYYDYSLVPQASCRAYFEQLADADFSVFSSALSYKLAFLFSNLRSCLGITNTSLSRDDISVMGNMCCILDGSYIENSDPSILEKLENCPDLSNQQTAAAEALLLSGKTQYGGPSTWNGQTLEDLGMLPLHLTSNFYVQFDKKTKRKFLRYFLKILKYNGVGRRMRRRLRKEIRKSVQGKSKRSTVNECTVGLITQVTIKDETFPFDYDNINQFNSCLSASITKDNLDSITDKVDEDDYLVIVLSKLREAYAADTVIPESQVQLLGPASHVATIDDINMWAITEIDTLSALFDTDQQLDLNLTKAIVSKYLIREGNMLGSEELNAIGGANLCFLDVEVLKNISQLSLKNANALNVSSCSTEKKVVLFTNARQAFDSSTRAGTVSVSTYQLIEPFLGGADLQYLQTLSMSNVSMDMATFTSLQENIVLNLNVDDVQGLLGSNVAELKSYENQTLVRSWIEVQPQSELDRMGLGLNGGRADTTASTNPTTASSPSATTTSSPTSTPSSGSSSSTTGSSTTGSSCSRIQADASFACLVLLVIHTVGQHIFV
ncbi:uncharacterized protein V6R79_016463 [Siganus canaliculatus]